MVAPFAAHAANCGCRATELMTHDTGAPSPVHTRARDCIGPTAHAPVLNASATPPGVVTALVRMETRGLMHCLWQLSSAWHLANSIKTRSLSVLSAGPLILRHCTPGAAARGVSIRRFLGPVVQIPSPSSVAHAPVFAPRGAAPGVHLCLPAAGAEKGGGQGYKPARRRPHGQIPRLRRPTSAESTMRTHAENALRRPSIRK